MARALAMTASSPLAHRRFTVAPGIVGGNPESSDAWRATLRLSSPAWLVQPQEHVLDVVGLEGGEREQRLDDRGREIVGAHRGQLAAVAAEGRAQPVVDVGIEHRGTPG